MCKSFNLNDFKFRLEIFTSPFLAISCAVLKASHGISLVHIVIASYPVREGITACRHHLFVHTDTKCASVRQKTKEGCNSSQYK